MSEPVLLVEKRDGVAILTLNRPTKLNALSTELRQALWDTLLEIESDADVGVVILTGAGRAFCAGLDLTEMGTHERPSAEELAARRSVVQDRGRDQADTG